MKIKKMKQIKALTVKLKGKLTAIASTENEDRMGDKVKISGWDLKNFKKNPVLLFAHNYSLPPIGFAKNIRIKDNKLVFEPVFHKITQLAREIGEMYTAEPALMTTWSVGFIAKQYNDKDRSVIEKQELLEVSAVPVPANADSLTVAEKTFDPADKKSVEAWINKEIKDFQDAIAENDDDNDELLEETDINAEVDENDIDEEKTDEEVEEESETLTTGKLVEEEKEEDEEVADEEVKPSEEASEDSVEEPTEEVKELETQMKDLKNEIAELKEGRVLSKKNRALIDKAVESMTQAASVLRDLSQATDGTSPQGEEVEVKKGRKEEAQELLKDKTVVRALQLISKELGGVLHTAKKIRK